MEVQASRGIQKRPCTAEVFEVVLSKQSRHLSSLRRRSFRGGQPPLHLGTKIFKCRNAVGFQSRRAEEMQQLADRKHSNVRGITQFFPAVLIGGPFGMFAAEDIFNENGPAEPAYPRHFSNHLRGVLHVMKRETAHHNVKLFLFEW